MKRGETFPNQSEESLFLSECHDFVLKKGDKFNFASDQVWNKIQQLR